MSNTKAGDRFSVYLLSSTFFMVEISVDVILLAVFQVGFQLIPRLAFADSHGAHEAESKPEPIKNLYLVRFAPKEGILQDQIDQFATSDFEAQDKMMESMGTAAIRYHASDITS